MKDIKWYRHPMLWTIIIAMLAATCIGLYLRWYHPEIGQQNKPMYLGWANRDWFPDSARISIVDSNGFLVKQYMIYYNKNEYIKTSKK